MCLNYPADFVLAVIRTRARGLTEQALPRGARLLISICAGANELFSASITSSDLCFLGWVQEDAAPWLPLCIRCHYGLAPLSVSVAFR